MTTLLRGGLVARRLSPPLLEHTDVLVDGDRVAAIGRDLPAVAGGTVLDATGCLVVPGAMNAHTHAYSALARGMPYELEPPTSFLEILQRVWWRLDRALDPDSIRASALVAARDALLSGTTTLVDHHASPYAIDGSLDIIAQAFAEAGIRSVLAYEVTDRDGPALAQAGLEENERFIRTLQRKPEPLTRAMVGAHACFTLTDDTLAGCIDLARRTRSGLHIHASEDDVDQGAIRRLASADGLHPSTLLAHAVHVDIDEVDLIRESGASVAHNCRSNMNNGVGRAPVDLLGARVALGTDGLDGDMFAETRAAYLRRRERAIDVGPGWAIDRLSGGTALVGRTFTEPLMGTLEPGAPADAVVLDYMAPTPIDSSNLAGHWIFGLSRADVRDVLVAGEVVVRNRHLTRLDEAELAATARQQATRVWKAFRGLPAHSFGRELLPARALVHAHG